MMKYQVSILSKNEHILYKEKFDSAEGLMVAIAVEHSNLHRRISLKVSHTL